MAMMYPKDRYAYTKSRAEKLLYPIFKTHLDNTYQVYHSRWWRFKYRTGETDFLVVNPEKGMLIVEVKGGKIRYDNIIDAWYSGSNKLTKSPYIQAEDTCKELVRWLKGRFNLFKNRNFTYKFCVLFPDIDFVKDIPSHGEGITLTGNDLGENFPEKIESILSSSPQGKDALGKDCLEELYRIIAPETSFKSYDINEIDRNNQLIKEFTEDQEIVLDELADFYEAIVLGCAGSGKTQLAIAKVRQLIRQKNRVLFTCKSLNLAGFIYLYPLREIIEDENSDLSVISFGNLAQRLREKNNLEIQDLKTLGQYDELKFDAIIVDEGQDFTNEDIQYLRSLLKDGNESIFYVFQDDNQNIHKNILGRKLNIHPRKLVKNLRNTKQIFEYFRPYVDGSNLTKPFGNEGPTVKTIEFNSMNQLINLIIQELDYLFKQSKITHNSIFIITNEDKNSSFLSENSQIGEHKIRYFSIIDDYNDYKNRNKDIKNTDVIKWSTVKEFKGLESDIVFYIQEKPISHIPTTEDINDRYIGYSRAKWMLVDFKEEEDEEDIW